MASVTIYSGFGAPQNKVCHCFHSFPIYLPWSDGTGCLYKKKLLLLLVLIHKKNHLFPVPWNLLSSTEFEKQKWKDTLTLLPIGLIHNFSGVGTFWFKAWKPWVIVIEFESIEIYSVTVTFDENYNLWWVS